jgi:hypothetical protein
LRSKISWDTFLRSTQDQDINWPIAICREFVIYHDLSEKNVVKFTYYDISKKHIRKNVNWHIVIGRHIRDILKKYITMKYCDISVIDINEMIYWIKIFFRYAMICHLFISWYIKLIYFFDISWYVAFLNHDILNWHIFYNLL